MTTEELAVFFQDEVVFCGCGNPGAAAWMMRDLLLVDPLYEHQAELRERVPDEGALYLLLYHLDQLGLTEHGTVVDGGWLTEKGQEVLAALNVEMERDEFDSLFDQRCSHGHLVEDRTHDCYAPSAKDAAAARIRVIVGTLRHVQGCRFYASVDRMMGKCDCGLDEIPDLLNRITEEG